MRYRIHWQIVLQITISLVVAFILLFLFVYQVARTTYLDYAVSSKNSQVSSLASKVDKIITKNITIVEHYARSIEYLYDTPDHRQRIANVTHNLMEEESNHIQGYWFTYDSSYRDQGQGDIRYTRTRNNTIVQNNSKDLMNPNDADTSQPENKDHPDYDFYFGAKRTGNTYITSPYIDPYMYTPMISVSSPVYDNQQQLMGVAGMNLMLDEVYQLGAQLTEQQQGYTLITRKDGGVIYHRDAKLTMNLNVYQNYDADFVTLYKDIIANQLKHNLTPVNRNGMYFFSAHIPAADWSLIVAVPERLIERKLIYILLGCIATVLCLIVLCYKIVRTWVSRSVSNPLSQILDGVEAVSQGDLTRRITVQASNEIGQLAMRLNVMIENLRTNHRMEEELKRVSSFQLIGQMASTMGNEVRHPLHSIRLFLHFLSLKPLYAEDARYFHMMMEEAERMDSILTEYLLLTQEKVPELKRQSLNSILYQMYPLLQALAAEYGQIVLLELQSVPDLQLDVAEIRKLIHHLVRNSIEAMDEGGTVFIRTMKTADGVNLIIEDQGRGIEGHILEQLGTPFLTTKENGAGLGLPICLSIVNRHGANLEVQSGNQHTRFNVRFPLPDGCTC
ncbi:sensor histidine kinase [Paenibacillus sp. ACRRX]|uniref:sensor histidine kinase n=1 Tax=Paenibacillus sp. ACRRX TaxID=2918206 RepID=UPI001EF499DF|nr:sensor histidine kinase [Paenibacillus sp. ACRRX]MCG7409069.1 sensor histidine kinase [Paenibacillus sp. ACRRX]